MNRKTPALLLLTLGLLTACAADPTATAPATSAPNTPAGTPVPTMLVPTPSAETGVVIGQILLSLDNSPLDGYIVYLGKATPLQPGDEYVITLKEQESPHIAADGEGRFALASEPGTYALVVWTPFHSKVLADPNDPTRELSIELVAGETVDVGALLVDWP